jgi:hypothetical protein
MIASVKLSINTGIAMRANWIIVAAFHTSI